MVLDIDPDTPALGQVRVVTVIDPPQPPFETALDLLDAACDVPERRAREIPAAHETAHPWTDRQIVGFPKNYPGFPKVIPGYSSLKGGDLDLDTAIKLSEAMKADDRRDRWRIALVCLTVISVTACLVYVLHFM